jgi:glycerophosphoryl diester phosphodiesterase
MVTPGFVRRVHRAGKVLYVWTVNDAVGMTRQFGMGVDALITDKPALAVRLLDQRGEMTPVERLLVTAGLLLVGETEHVDPKTDGI